MRNQALTLLARHDPDRTRTLLRDALLDRSAGIRGLARFLASTLDSSLDARALYLERLDQDSPSSLSTAVLGLPDVVDVGARKGFLRLFAEAPKWDAAVFLLTALGDSDRVVRDRAAELLVAWVARFNRRHTAPTPAHPRQIRVLLETHGAALSTDTAGLLRSLALEP